MFKTVDSEQDDLLDQDTIVSEMRKQKTELHNVFFLITEMREDMDALLASHEALSNKIEDRLPEEEDTECSEDLSFEEEEGAIRPLIEPAEAEVILIQSLDALLTLTSAAYETKLTVLNLLPKITRFWRRSPPLWKTEAKQVLSSYVQGVVKIRDRLIASLADLSIQVVIPLENELFDPTIHRAIEQVSGGASRTIAKVVRYGYVKNGQMLRCADVAVYK